MINTVYCIYIYIVNIVSTFLQTTGVQRAKYNCTTINHIINHSATPRNFFLLLTKPEVT